MLTYTLILRSTAVASASTKNSPRISISVISMSRPAPGVLTCGVIRGLRNGGRTLPGWAERRFLTGVFFQHTDPLERQAASTEAKRGFAGAFMGGICSCGREGRTNNADDADLVTRCPDVVTLHAVEKLVDIVHNVKRVLDLIGDRLDSWDEVVPWRSEMIVWKFNTLCHLELVARACKDHSRRKEGDDYLDNTIRTAVNSAGDALAELIEIGQSVIAGTRPKPCVKDVAFGSRLEAACVKIQDATKLCSVALKVDGDAAINIQTRHDAAQHEVQVSSVADDGGTRVTMHDRCSVTPPGVAVVTTGTEVDGTEHVTLTEAAGSAKTIPVNDGVPEQQSQEVAAAPGPDTSNDSVDQATDDMVNGVIRENDEARIVTDESAEYPSVAALETALSVSSTQFEGADDRNCPGDPAQSVLPEPAEAHCKQGNCAEAVTKIAFSPSTGQSDKADEQTRKGDLAQAKLQILAVEQSTPDSVCPERGGSAEPECGIVSSRPGFFDQIDCASEENRKGVAAQSAQGEGDLLLNQCDANDMPLSDEGNQAEAVLKRASPEPTERNDKGDATPSLEQKAISGMGTQGGSGADARSDESDLVLKSPLSTNRVARMAEQAAGFTSRKSEHQESAVAVCRRGMVLAAVEKYAGTAHKVVPAEAVHRNEKTDVRRRKADPALLEGQESHTTLHERGMKVAMGEATSRAVLTRASSNSFVERIERAEQPTEESDPVQCQRQESAVALYTRGTALAVEGKYAEAAPMLEIAVKKNPQLDCAWYSLCVADRELGKYKDAARDCRRAIELLEKSGETKTTKFGRALNELGLILQAEARYDEADELYYRALDLFETLRGKNDASTATVLTNIASLLTARVTWWPLQKITLLPQGKYAEAIPLSKRALRIEENNLGDNHPQVAMSLNMIAWLLSLQVGCFALVFLASTQERSHHESF